jgi:SAM-dependent methyltransferase
MHPMRPDMVGRLYAAPLRDLGAEDERFRGILAPVGAASLPSGVTAQFLGDAEHYDARYTNVEYFRHLVDRALRLAAPVPAGGCILDIGSGSGNSVIPLLDRFPDAFVVATDISPQLLAILRRRLEASSAYAGRYALVCMDAAQDVYRPAVFDLAVGAAILHHLVEPQAMIHNCAAALRSHASAIFFEPFEMGHVLARIAYERILARVRPWDRRRRWVRFLRGLVAEYALRVRDKSDPAFARVDDKWFFTRDFFASNAEGLWERCDIEALNPSSEPLTQHTRTLLRLGLDAEPDVLPAWAWEIIARTEAAFSASARRDLILEGSIVLRRGARQAGHDPNAPGWWWNPAQSGRGFFIDRRGHVPRVLCCVYGEDGAPSAFELGEAGGEAFELAFYGDAITLELRGQSIALQRQYEAAAASPFTGWWRDPTGECGTIVCESLPGRLAAAWALGEWRITVAERLDDGTYAGDWLAFRDGQALGQPHRAPRHESQGRASFALTPAANLVVRLPGGGLRSFEPVQSWSTGGSPLNRS